MGNDILRRIPKIDVLLGRPALVGARERHPQALIKSVASAYMDELRNAALKGLIDAIPSIGEIETELLDRLDNNGYYSLKRVINATGVVLHTNLGRAPLGESVTEHVASVSKGYCNLEYDLNEGARGSRYTHIEKLLCRLTGAEAAMVVNNNAAAVFLMLNTLAKGRKTAVSRGELVEIGGSFRVPEIMRESGAELMEIGTTNKTHPYDYERACENGAEVLLKVHTSNFVMNGFTESVDVPELRRIADAAGAMLLYDLGGGFMFTKEALGVKEGYAVFQCLRDGADVVCFSGDKLFGSAQCGILIGKKEYIEKIKKNQLTRMLRIDKLSLAAVEATLQYCADITLAKERIPVIRMLSMDADECKLIAERLKAKITEYAPECECELMPLIDEAGGGSLPGAEFEGWGVAVSIPWLDVLDAEKTLRKRRVPIIVRTNKGNMVFSARTITDDDILEIASAMAELTGGMA